LVLEIEDSISDLTVLNTSKFKLSTTEIFGVHLNFEKVIKNLFKPVLKEYGS